MKTVARLIVFRNFFGENERKEAACGGLWGGDAPFDFTQGRLCPPVWKLVLVKLRAEVKTEVKTKVKGGGQDCPPHTS
jgi:hypothetical protein